MASSVKGRFVSSRLLQHCPPQCSGQGWIAVQVGVLFLSSSALVSGVALLLALTLWRPKAEPPPLSRLDARLLAALSLLMLPPRKLTSPAAGCRPMIALSRVVLPAPLGPTTETIEPWCTVRLTPRRTEIFPYPALRGPT